MGIREQIDMLPYLPPLTVFCGCINTEELASELSKKFNIVSRISEISIDEVRDVIKSCYTISHPMVYIFPNVENMSINAINSLLKITEEPPNSSVFVLTIDNINNLISTIRSRAVVLNEISKKLVFDKNLIDFCNLVYDNIEIVSLTNALKIGGKIKLKENDEGFDLNEFFLCMLEVINEHFLDYVSEDDVKNMEKLYEDYKITNECLRELKYVKGVKKDALLDEWIIKIRS